MYLIVYDTEIHSTIYKNYRGIPIDKKVGDINGYGWKIITIQILTKKRYYNLKNYKQLLKENEEKENNKRTRISKLIRLVDLLLSD
mgnify:CR=1 FL=1